MFRKVEESQTLLINTQSRNLVAQNKKIYKFGFGQSPFMPPKQVLDALKNSVHHKEYTSVQGDLELREYMAEFHRSHNGIQVDPDNILIAPGSKTLLFSILMAFEKADVFIPAPAWVSYAPQAQLAGHHIIKLPTSIEKRWRIDPQIISEAAKNKRHKASILILNYPGNPDGLTYSKTELEDLARTARSLDILVISDEIYGLLDHNQAHLSLGNFYPEKTITTTGLSKWCGAGGWRFGAAFLYNNIEPEFKQALIGIGSETYSCAPAPVQMAAKVAYRSHEEIRPYLSWQTSILKKVGNFCSGQLNASGIRVHAPQGGFYLFIDFSGYREELQIRGISTSNQLCLKLLEETGVVLLPATGFGFDESYLAARLAYVDFDVPDMSIDFNLIEHSPRVVKGIEKIGNWISAM